MNFLIGWYKGRDCGPRSEQGIAAKAASVANEGPAGAVRHGRKAQNGPNVFNVFGRWY